MKEFMNRLPRLGKILSRLICKRAMVVYDNIGTEQYWYDDQVNIIIGGITIKAYWDMIVN